MKRILIIILASLCFSFLGKSSAFSSEIVPDISWYVNNITSDTYEIKNANQLAGLANIVNGTTGFFSPYDFFNKTIFLAADIDLGCYIDSDGAFQGSHWTTIGKTYSTRFAGIFDGNGYCITGMIIRPDDDGIGALFGYNSGEIKNLTIAGGFCFADYYLAGSCSHNSGVIEHCINRANGICNNYGGGICGKNYEGGQIKNCFNFGYVADRNCCGGIVGSASLNNAVITNCVYDIQMCPLKKGCGTIELKAIKGLSTNQIIGASGYSNDGAFVLEDGMYPKLSSTKWTKVSKAALTPVVFGEAQDVNNITKDIYLKRTEEIEYFSSNQQYLEVKGYTAIVRERADVSLLIKGGSCTRQLFIKITNENFKQNGNEHSPLRISGYEDFIKFANAVNYCSSYKGFTSINGFEGVTVVLTGNILIPEGVNWKPVGSRVTPFRGTFVGYGFCVSNLKINRPYEKNCGLFGYCEGAITKIVVTDGEIVGGDNSGAIVGFINKGRVEKCISAIRVHGHYNVGGICGNSNESSFSQVLFYNTAEGVSEYTGAICGNATMSKFSHCIFDKQMCVAERPVGSIDNSVTMLDTKGLNTRDMVGNSLESRTGFSFDFQYEDNMYPKILSVQMHEEAIVASTPVFITEGQTAFNVSTSISLPAKEEISYYCNNLDILKISKNEAVPLQQGAVMLTIGNRAAKKHLVFKITNSDLKALGTKENPILLSSPDDISALRKAVNNNTDYKGFSCVDGFNGVYFKLTKSIYYRSNENQMPIGNYLFPFKGVFDGGGYTISGFNCNHENLDNVGFVGYNAGVIKNLKLSRSPISGRYYSGGICGFNVGKIINCEHDSASVTGNNFVGGIVGYDNGGVFGCKNFGSVKCDFNTGGIAGATNNLIDSCFNSGIITGTAGVGGITGSCTNVVQNSHNSGKISAGDNTGGIVGRNSYGEVISCINSGEIEGYDCTGGIVGLNDGVIKKCINDSIVTSNLSSGGIAGKGGKIYFCYNNATVSSSGNNAAGIVGATKNNSEVKYCVNKGKISAQAFAGGICADNSGGKIISCVNFGYATASYYIGGICGYNSGTISTSLSLGQIFGNSYYGAICGRENSGIIDRCFYDNNCKYRGIDNADVFQKAEGMDYSSLISSAIKYRLQTDDYIFEDGKVPMPKEDE